MMKSVITCAAFAVLGILLYNGLLYVSIYILFHVAIAAVTFYLTVSWQLIQGKLYKPPAVSSPSNLILQNPGELDTQSQNGQRRVVISRNLDLTLEEILNLIIRDFLLTWYQDLAKDTKRLENVIRVDTWTIIEEISSRLSKIDLVKFVTSDVVNRVHVHFREIRHASRREKGLISAPKFILHSWLENEELEIDFLRQISQCLLVILLPKEYSRSEVTLHLLRELLTVSVFKPTVDLMCDPDYINQKLIDYIDYRQKLSEDTRKTYTYAATYEDFVKMIDNNEDVEHLKQIRYNIMTEIMQATTINNLKKAQGIESDKESVPKSTAKGELLKSRNLSRYINQLTVAKLRCEKRIQASGGPDYKYTSDDLSEGQNPATLQEHKVLSFEDIMDTGGGREQFMRFLKKDDNHSWLGFWNGVEKLRTAEKRQKHQLASEIYQQYISSKTSAVKLDKNILKGMEAFLLGDTGPEAFYDGQSHVYNKLEKQFYPSFLVSDIYHKYASMLLEEAMGASAVEVREELFFEPQDADVDDASDDSSDLVSQSYHAQQKLKRIDEKIVDKTHALLAWKNSQTSDPKNVKVQEELEKELESLKLERRQLEGHILRTDQWCHNQGHWKAHIYNAEVVHEGDKLVPYFVIVVHLQGGSSGTSTFQSSAQGWLVSRTLDDFNNLHQKLIQIGAWLKKKELPSMGVTKFFKSVDTAFLEKAKSTLDDYLSAVMKDDRMAQCESLYAFLTPTPEYLKLPPSEKKSKFFLKNLLKSLPTIGQDNPETVDESLFTDDSIKEDRSKDSIAEPLYGLINEVFELRGMFKWLRKSFIAFVEVTFGRSINRQLRETVEWIFSEPMIIYYLRNLQDSMWPNGQLAEALPCKTDEEKFKTRILAKEKIMQNIPDALKSLVGEDNSKRGAIKMFEVLQDVRLNKHLFYDLLELTLYELCPEIKETKDVS